MSACLVASRRLVVLLLSAAALASCGRPAAERTGSVVAAASAAPATTSFYGTPFERKASAAELASLGRTLFFDKALSASTRMACASCHDPAHAFGPPTGVAVQTGGVDGRQPGLRAVPSLMYGQDTPPFAEHFSDTDGDDSVDQGPTGGRGWDGRASSAHEQAALPLLSSFEMANGTSEQAVARLRNSPSAEAFRATFGQHVFDTPAVAWNGLLLALEVFQQNPAEFYPYSSKYDAFLRGKASLTASERHGMELFNDSGKGNCALCHPSAIKRGAFPQFTDRGLVAIGVPRNPAIPANADPAFFDLGLCGPLRTDLRDRLDDCGRFKTPTLRNVATRGAFFHNGAFHRLDDAVRFYALRDAAPGRVYGKDGRGRVLPYDDLPRARVGNVDREPPFGQRSGARPILSEHDIADIVAFLKTLTDGYAR